MFGAVATSSLLTPARASLLCQLCIICIIASVCSVGIITGISLNAYVYASKAWLPQRAAFERPLFFDYSSTGVATASAHFKTWHQAADGHMLSPETVNFLKAGQTVEVTLEFVLPERPENDGLFMLEAELRADEATTLHRMHQPLIMKHRSALLRTARTLLFLPLYTVGLLQDTQNIRVIAVKRYREVAKAPLASIHVALRSTVDGAPAPYMYNASVYVRTRLGMLGFLLSFCRLSPLLHMALFILATSLLMMSILGVSGACIFAIRTVIAIANEPVVTIAAEAPVPLAKPAPAPAGRGSRSREPSMSLPSSTAAASDTMLHDQMSMYNRMNMRNRVKSAEQLSRQRGLPLGVGSYKSTKGRERKSSSSQSNSNTLWQSTSISEIESAELEPDDRGGTAS